MSNTIPLETLTEQWATCKRRVAEVQAQLTLATLDRDPTIRERLKRELEEAHEDRRKLAALVREARVIEQQRSDRHDDLIEQVGYVQAVRDFMVDFKLVRKYFGDIGDLYRRWTTDRLPATAAECLEELRETLGEFTDDE